MPTIQANIPLLNTKTLQNIQATSNLLSSDIQDDLLLPNSFIVDQEKYPSYLISPVSEASALLFSDYIVGTQTLLKDEATSISIASSY